MVRVLLKALVVCGTQDTVFLDVGMHIGNHAIVMAQHGFQVWGVEPLEGNLVRVRSKDTGAWGQYSGRWSCIKLSNQSMLVQCGLDQNVGLLLLKMRHQHTVPFILRMSYAEFH